MIPTLTQATRSLEEFDRRQVAYVHQHHIDEAKLQSANTAIINFFPAVFFRLIFSSAASPRY